MFHAAAAVALALLCTATAAGRELVATQPSDVQRKGAAASFLSALIILLVLFVVFVAVMMVLRRRLVPYRRPQKRVPTDASDLWSLAGQREARRKAGKEEPTEPMQPTDPEGPQDDQS